MLTAVRTKPARARLALAVAVASLVPMAQADFIEDSRATLQTQNIYLNRDFREGTGQSKREEWSQGFLLNIESGFTEGTVGFGVDAMGMLGIKLDSGGGRAGTDLLPVQDDGGTPDEFSRLGLTAKARLSETELRYGSHIPETPVVKASDSRTLPQVFEGAMLVSQDVTGLTLSGGRLNKVIDRASTNSQELQLNNKNSRFSSAAEADHLTFAGARYDFSETFTGTYYAAELDDIYRQHFFNLQVVRPLGEDAALTADLRLMISDDTGAANAGKIDNQAWNGTVGYSLGGHKVSLAFQQMNGDTGYAYIDGGDPYLVNFVQINDFANADERSWQARYDYNFASIGVPGLTFLTRYVSGDNAEYAGGSNGSEWERDIELKYVVQTGPLKNVAVRMRNAMFRSDFARDADENRLIVSYSLPIW
ncbi:OprD family porin [Stutzerimonas zhaodongensis]|uniref:OprD family porin n=1 Tax=Stutzerimonas zhaodongensis TaxID=1176257 RepID=A0A3M2HUB7_9GAMM|nr:OprD family porin [Stutzerimonas zhaodongensis]MCQ2028064.1 OprD family porin [Stutzerimonas zhaodongensis]MCQ4315716.1 OprD family porin [Stutzerimonas zhaodongensis]RMH91423.1 OprD family porin [Stutzerimonas zhaodongensis]